MSQHDYVIDNQSAPAFRADLNSALGAIVTQNSGSTAPTATFANMIWYDTATNQLKKRNEANSAWVTLGTIDEGAGTFTPTGGTVTIASQAEAEAGTDNTKMMTPLRVAQAVAAQTGYSSYSVYASSSSFVTPAGVTSGFAIVIGGGGGGGSSGSDRDGGNGGLAAGVIALSGTMAVTVGAGGAGNNGGNGGAGGTSSFGAFSATGGTGGTTVRGTDGVGSGGSLNKAMTNSATFAALLALANADSGVVPHMASVETTRENALTSTAAISYTASGIYAPGANGSGETGGTTNDASGGVGGAVFVFY